MSDDILMNYANIAGIDIGRLSEYTLDLAYGASENSFALTMPNNSVMLEEGQIVYCENDADIGGIITKIKSDSVNRKITYTGPTWHGFLSQHIIEPPKKQDYFLASGDANTVIGQILRYTDLQNYFIADTELSGITILSYRIRYNDVYSSLIDMLYTYNAKLKLTLAYGQEHNVYIKLSAVPLIDYSQNEEWSSSQRDFVAEKNYKPVNHIICLGSGNLKDRYVIHLYSDGSNIMPYKKVGIAYNGQVVQGSIYRFYISVNQFPPASQGWLGVNVALTDGTIYQCTRQNSEYQWNILEGYSIVDIGAVKDDDYFLDSRYQMLAGIDESAIIFDYPNAETKQNFVLLESKPSDWESNYQDYYYYSDGNYKNMEGIEAEDFVLLASAPSDWTSDPEKYYKIVDGNYTHVDKVDAYAVLNTQPDGWNYPDSKFAETYKLVDGVYKQTEGVAVINYEVADITTARNEWSLSTIGNYYTRSWNGVSWVYTAVPSITAYSYICQTSEPSDWATNYNNYYQRNSNTDGYKKVTGVKKKVRKQTTTVAPKWKKNKYYTRYPYQALPAFSYSQGELWRKTSYTDAPTFVSGTYYVKEETGVAPTFATNTYYTLKKSVVAPAFNVAYIKYDDHYADLTEKGIKKFQELLNCDKISITLKPSEQYDIGDIVGATDEVTGLSVWQPITKKIIKIQRNRKTVDYEIGRRY